MLFFKIYLVSTIIALIICLLTVKAIAAKLKREGFKTHKKTSVVEILHSLLPLLIPGINILLTIGFIFDKDRIEKKIKYKL